MARYFDLMIRALTKLRWCDYAVVVCGLVLAAFIGASDPRIVMFPKASVHTGGRSPDLSERAAKAFAQHFAKGGYFGAFAVGQTGSYGWTVSHSSLRAARANALAYCGATGPGCRIVSDLVPDGYEPEEGTVTLRHRDSVNFQAYLKRAGPKAFAIAENGTYGAAFGRLTPWTARLAALRNCRKRVHDNQREYLPDWPCRVIHASWR